jgi:hypothetical protein
LLYRSYDYKIILKSDKKKFTYSPLYKINTKELEAMKQYLLKNLNKSFIKTNQVFFIVFVFFVKKPNKSLRFYIDYYKLNSLNRKDRYLLPLIDETLARILRAKIFLKLDIR